MVGEHHGAATFAVRRTWIKEKLAEGAMWPTSQDIMRAFPGTSKTAAYRDVAEVARVIFKGVEMDKIRAQLLVRLAVRIPTMKDADLIKLMCALFPQPQEIKSQVEVKGQVGVAVGVLLKQYSEVIRGTVNRTVQTNGPVQ